MAAVIQYKTGDIVVLRNDLNPDWDSSMEKYLGTTVVIRTAASVGFNIAEDLQNIVFRHSDVIRIANEEDLVKKKEKDEIEKARVKEALSKLVYKTDDVYKLACGVFGEERVDKDSNLIKIYFPEIEMTNTPEAKHTIKDLYVYIQININKSYLERVLGSGNFLGDIKLLGERGSFSIREYETYYRHSHLPGGTAGSSSFCLGNSDFGLLVQELRMNLTEELWMLMFYSLNNYLAWESLEGGPHVKMNTIKYVGQVSHGVLKEELKRIFGGFPKELLEVRETVSLNAHHPSLGEYVNRVSPIKSLDKITQSDIEERVKTYTNQLKKNPIAWKGDKRPLFVYNDDNEKPDVNTPVKAEVLEQYAEIIENKAKEFTKKLNYDRAKTAYKERVFGKVRIKQ